VTTTPKSLSVWRGPTSGDKLLVLNSLTMVEAAGVEPAQGIDNTQVADFKNGQKG
jgi:hypothetical protein